MTVAELITTLKTLQPSLPVVCFDIDNRLAPLSAEPFIVRLASTVIDPDDHIVADDEALASGVVVGPGFDAVVLGMDAEDFG